MSLDIYLERNGADDPEELYWANYTHNIIDMADAAGIYQCLWEPQANGITCARDLIEPLNKGLTALVTDPNRFKEHNPPNGWGKYETFVPWLIRLREACEKYPEAKVRVSR